MLSEASKTLYSLAYLVLTHFCSVFQLVAIVSYDLICVSQSTGSLEFSLEANDKETRNDQSWQHHNKPHPPVSLEAVPPLQEHGLELHLEQSKVRNITETRVFLQCKIVYHIHISIMFSVRRIVVVPSLATAEVEKRILEARLLQTEFQLLLF